MSRIQQLACTSMGFASRLGLDKKLDRLPQKMVKGIIPPFFKGITAYLKRRNVKDLDSKRLSEFLEKLAKKECEELGIPEEFRPPVYYIDDSIKVQASGYFPEVNAVIINLKHMKSNGKLSLERTRSTLRHELKHAQQYFDIARSGNMEDVGRSYPSTLQQLALQKHKRPSLDPERIKAFQEYSPGANGHFKKIFEIQVLASSKAKAFGFKDYDDLLENGTRKIKAKFWKALKADFKPGGRKDRVEGALKRLSLEDQADRLERYANSIVEVEAREHSGEIGGSHDSGAQAKTRAAVLRAKADPVGTEIRNAKANHILKTQGLSALLAAKSK